MDQLTTEEAAAYLRTPIPTLRWWRHIGRGPKSYRIGRRVFYLRQDVDDWHAEQMTATARGQGCP